MVRTAMFVTVVLGSGISGATAAEAEPPPAAPASAPRSPGRRIRPLELLVWSGFGSSVVKLVAESPENSSHSEYGRGTLEVGFDLLLTLGPVAAGGTVAGSGAFAGYTSTYRGLLGGLRLQPKERLQIALVAETGWHEVGKVGRSLFGGEGALDSDTFRYSGGQLIVTGMVGRGGWLLLGGLVGIRVDHETRRRTVSAWDLDTYDVGGTNVYTGISIGLRP